MTDSNWRLGELKIEFKAYGEHKGKYSGKIRFENDESESFCFVIRPEQTQRLIDIMAEEIVSGADSLARKLCESLGLENRLSKLEEFVQPDIAAPKKEGEKGLLSKMLNFKG